MKLIHNLKFVHSLTLVLMVFSLFSLSVFYGLVLNGDSRRFPAPLMLRLKDGVTWSELAPRPRPPLRTFTYVVSRDIHRAKQHYSHPYPRFGSVNIFKYNYNDLSSVRIITWHAYDRFISKQTRMAESSLISINSVTIMMEIPCLLFITPSWYCAYC